MLRSATTWFTTSAPRCSDEEWCKALQRARERIHGPRIPPQTARRSRPPQGRGGGTSHRGDRAPTAQATSQAPNRANDDANSSTTSKDRPPAPVIPRPTAENVGTVVYRAHGPIVEILDKDRVRLAGQRLTCWYVRHGPGLERWLLNSALPEDTQPLTTRYNKEHPGKH